MMVGRAEWLVDQPASVAASIWTSGEAVVLRLTSRKNRPRGSLLRRRCRCKQMRGSQFCIFHRLAERMAGKKPGESLWNFKAHEALARIRGSLSAVGYMGTSMSWKGFRAGKASCMAAQGCTIGEILTAGEWKSRALLAYVDEIVIDSAAMLQETMHESEDEAEPLPIL